MRPKSMLGVLAGLGLMASSAAPASAASVSYNISATINMSGTVDDMAVDNGLHLLNVLVTNNGTSQLLLIDETSGATMASIALPAPGDAVLVDSTRHEAFVSDSSGVMTIDEQTDTVTGTLPISFSSPSVLSLDPIQGLIISLFAGSGTTPGGVDEWDETTGTLVTSFPFQAPTSDGPGQSIGVDPVTKTVYVAMPFAIENFDEQTGASLLLQPENDSNGPIAVDTKSHLAYVLDHLPPGVVYTGAANGSIQFASGASGPQPTDGIAVAQPGQTILAATEISITGNPQFTGSQLWAVDETTQTATQILSGVFPLGTQLMASDPTLNMVWGYQNSAPFDRILQISAGPPTTLPETPWLPAFILIPAALYGGYGLLRRRSTKGPRRPSTNPTLPSLTG